MPKKRKYTQAEIKAYYCGMGYSAGQKDKPILFASYESRESFRAGRDAASKSKVVYGSKRNKYKNHKR